MKIYHNKYLEGKERYELSLMAWRCSTLLIGAGKRQVTSSATLDSIDSIEVTHIRVDRIAHRDFGEPAVGRLDRPTGVVCSEGAAGADPPRACSRATQTTLKYQLHCAAIIPIGNWVAGG